MHYHKEFTGRRPSEKQVKKEIVTAAKLGATNIDIDWGENGITLELIPFGRDPEWLGYGWIGRISGQDLAKEL